MDVMQIIDGDQNSNGLEEIIMSDGDILHLVDEVREEGKKFETSWVPHQEMDRSEREGSKKDTRVKGESSTNGDESSTISETSEKSKHQGIDMRKFEHFCVLLKSKLRLEELPVDAILKENQSKTIDKTLMFLKNVINEYPHCEDVQLLYLAQLTNCDVQQIREYLMSHIHVMSEKAAKEDKEEDKEEKQQSTIASGINKLQKKTKTPKATESGSIMPNVYSQDEYESFCEELKNKIGLNILRSKVDFRHEFRTEVKNVKSFLQGAFDRYPNSNQSQLKHLSKITGADFQSVRNFFLLRYRQKFPKANPPFLEKQRVSAVKRIPWNPQKGLGCSKCRYAPNGCNTCGYWAGGGSKPSIKKPVKKVKKTSLRAAPKPSLKIKLSLRKDPHGVKVKKINKVLSSSNKHNAKALQDKQKEMRRLEINREIEQRIDQTPCARCIPFSKNFKQEYYNDKHHVTNSTTATAHSHRSNCRKLQDVRSQKKISRLNTLVRIGKSPVHAWGLFAKQKIKKGTRVIEYIGQLIRHVLSDKREQMYESNGLDSSYLFRVGSNVIDATVSGGPARYINHSCSPNCQPKQYLSEKKIFIFAIKDIEEGAELCYDYKFDIDYNSDDRIPCTCGSSNCRGFMN